MTSNVSLVATRKSKAKHSSLSLSVSPAAVATRAARRRADSHRDVAPGLLAMAVVCF
jgi:hypothetical protein